MQPEEERAEMYCPKCATENLETARYCRACGTDISLVPQALTGHLPAAVEEESDDDSHDWSGKRKRKNKRPMSMEKSITNIFMGLGFLALALALSRSPVGMFWWYWMLIPAFSMMGGGVAGLVRARREEQRRFPAAGPMVASTLPPARASALPPRNTSEILQPPSITEGTTRHLGAEAPTRHIGESNSNQSYQD
jgi:hypothetical protein